MVGRVFFLCVYRHFRQIISYINMYILVHVQLIHTDPLTRSLFLRARDLFSKLFPNPESNAPFKPL